MVCLEVKSVDENQDGGSVKGKWCTTTRDSSIFPAWQFPICSPILSLTFSASQLYFGEFSHKLIYPTIGRCDSITCTRPRLAERKSRRRGGRMTREGASVAAGARSNHPARNKKEMVTLAHRCTRIVDRPGEGPCDFGLGATRQPVRERVKQQESWRELMKTCTHQIKWVGFSICCWCTGLCASWTMFGAVKPNDNKEPPGYLAMGQG